MTYKEAFFDELEKIASSVDDIALVNNGKALRYSNFYSNWALGPRFKQSGPGGMWTRPPDFWDALNKKLKGETKFTVDKEGYHTATVDIPLSEIAPLIKKNPGVGADLKEQAEQYIKGKWFFKNRAKRNLEKRVGMPMEEWAAGYEED